jgi:hypothetical protein
VAYFQGSRNGERRRPWAWDPRTIGSFRFVAEPGREEMLDLAGRFSVQQTNNSFLRNELCLNITGFATCVLVTQEGTRGKVNDLILSTLLPITKRLSQRSDADPDLAVGEMVWHRECPPISEKLTVC